MSQTVIKLHFTPTQASLRERLVSAWARLRTSLHEAATRRQLGRLDDRALSDIGISRAQANFMAETPIWDLHR